MLTTAAESTPGLPTYAVESVDNAMKILLLLQEREVLRVVDCSEALGIARSTAHRLLMTIGYRAVHPHALTDCLRCTQAWLALGRDV